MITIMPKEPLINCHSRAGGNPESLKSLGSRLRGNDGFIINQSFPKFIVIFFILLISFSLDSRADETPKAPFTLNYGEWTLVCDNVHRCEALTLGDTNGLILRVIRDAGPTGDIRLSLTSGNTNNPADHFYIDGQAIVFKNLSWKKKIFVGEASLFEFSIDNEAEVTEFTRAISQGNALSIAQNSTSKKHNISLTGFNESLLLMDEIQGRKNNETALAPAAKGKNPRSLVPRAPTAPRIKVTPYSNKFGAEAASLINAVRKKMRDTQCNDERQNNSDAAYALSQQHALVVIECAAGAYNISSHVYLATRGKTLPKITVLALPSIPKAANMDLIFNANYATGSSILTQSRKSRGLNDCGDFARWAFDGNQFKLLEYRQFELCKNGVHFDFPRLWHADIFDSQP